MRINHVSIWTRKLEEMRDFYVQVFNGKASDRYMNPRTGFESYFIRFDEETTLELMRVSSIRDLIRNPERPFAGLAHIAFSVGSRTRVDQMTELLEECGYSVTSQPKVTGDGFYESCILDPDGNLVEITE
ncbi:MAG TPA: VOC family protein [Patescibacteria group bacterium]|nr:VOC family protein [Patescibacteria group bacterium]